MRIYHIGSKDWDLELFEDRRTGAKFEVPMSELCPDCWTPAADVVRTEGKKELARPVHDKTCLTLKRRVTR